MIDFRPYGRICSRDGVGFRSKEDAEQLLNEIRQRIANGESPAAAVAKYAPSSRKVVRLPVGHQAPWQEDYRSRILLGAKRRSERDGIPFDLTIEDIVIPTRCPVLGITLRPSEAGEGRHDAAPSIDRIKPELGYVRGNTVIISWRANCLKRDATAIELRRLADWLEFIESCPQA